jgi:hypothetical protein
MEYLMTYGWAILVLAVAVGVLFELGVFNPYANMPKALEGACQVSRPNGPGTVQYIGLTGLCNSEIPQSVAVFNGQSSYVGLPSLQVTGSISMSAWIRLAKAATASEDVVARANTLSDLFEISVGDPVRLNLVLSGTNVNINTGGFALAAGTWYHVVETYNSATGAAAIYVNGVQEGSGSGSGNLANTGNGWAIGQIGTGSRWFNGSISDVQVYNTALSANDAIALYQEGIGGVPINIVNLVAWWPLNSDTYDYSGDNYNGAATGVVYSTTWYNSYTAPP